MAASSSNPSTIVYKENPYPYPSHVFVANFLTVKLTGINDYGVWKTQILCLLVSHGMMGFINGEFLCPNQPDEGTKKQFMTMTKKKKKKKDGDIEAWLRSDALVKGWILGSLSKRKLKDVVDNLNKNSSDFTARELWERLDTLYLAVNKEEKETREIQPMRQQNLITQSANSTDDGTEKQETDEKEKAEIAKAHESLYEATLRQNFEDVAEILNKNEKLKLSTKITHNGNTAIHVAVETTKNVGFIKKIFDFVKDKSVFLEKNADGCTLLHIAAIAGNTEAAKMLVEEKKELLLAKDNDGKVPLVRAHYNMHKDTYNYLLEQHNHEDLEMGTGDELMYNVITSQDYHLAKALIDKNPKVHRGYVLIAIAQNFPRKLSIWETILHKFGRNPDKRKATAMKKILGFFSIIYQILLIISYILLFILFVAFLFGIPAAFIYGQVVFWKKNKGSKRWFLILINLGGQLGIAVLYFVMICVADCMIHLGRWLSKMMSKLTYFLAKRPLLNKLIRTRTQKQTSSKATSWFSMPFLNVFKKLSRKTNIREMGAKMHNDAIELLASTCIYIKGLEDAKSYVDYYNNAVLEATRENAYEVVETIVTYFPNAIWSLNEDGHNIIQYAVINRSEMVYNLLYQMSEHKNVYKIIVDSLGNNLLHLAARLAPPEKLNTLSGAALQVQRELQWFKEVEQFVCSLNTIQKNHLGETPQMLFTKEHKELVTEGEKWMKTTAESYTITAALITTIAFAAAITVPGGNQDTGIPIFSKKSAFTIFAISDAISLFTSVTSLLMFLSILTARFAEQDFLFKLPTKLIIGLITLFISTTAMIVAFGATLYLVFGKTHSWILAPIAILTCLPVSSFVFLQYPLIRDLVSSTYIHNIFGKKSDKLFY